MGILDEAIRDHLDLKRKGGTPQPDLKRLEDEAFGPPSRPGDAEGATAVAEAEAPRPESGSETESPSASAPPPSAPVEEAPRPSADRPENGGESLFHDFAAEEGLVGPPGTEPPARTAETPSPQPEPTPEPEPAPPPEPSTPPPEPATPAPETPAAERPAATPSGEPGFDDTQPHDMQTEFDEESLELHLDEDDLAAPEGSDKPSEPPSESAPELEVVEEEVEEIEVEVEEVPAEDEEDGEDVLEETPEFLRDTPEHDRLWFEQKPPKDFDFDK
jgi:hypothetical protein